MSVRACGAVYLEGQKLILPSDTHPDARVEGVLAAIEAAIPTALDRFFANRCAKLASAGLANPGPPR
ncbi:MAG: hypothetical protein B7Z10_07560 [Rhodobacterales bacterium 32-66-7]|nr:MAG: hypothetical protein B7Z31_10205 [Rhodobacterales bacterium 12-65-15]OYX25022.1 MAG: hypothetical protein B7Z10_07560 [Rhodobacterales bacterium 32-66-7]